MNVVNDTTTAGLPANVVLTGVKDLTINATSTDSMTTSAEGGAAAAGSVALSAQVAIAISNVTTTASIGSGSTPLVISGKLAAKAVQVAKTTTTAKGDTKGGNAGIGLSLALLIANHNVESKLERSLTAGGDVSFEADGVSANDTEATASSAGAEGKKDGNQGSTDSSNKDVNKKADDNAKVGENLDSSSKTSGKKTPEASSGEDGGTKVTVAAAVAIAIVSANALSSLDDALQLVTTGATSFKATEDVDSTAKANASAVKGATANIAAAVAINKIAVVNAAVIGDSTIDSHGLTLSALMNSTNGANAKHSFDTLAVSGAGEGKVGISGALALTIADITTNAELKDNHTRGPPLYSLNRSDLSLSAASVVDSTAKAKAKDDDAKTVGIGAGVAINIVNHTTTASIDSGASFDVSSKPKDVSLSATATDTMTTSSEAGVQAKSGSDLALTPDVSISYPTVLTSATIGGDNTQSLDVTGNVTLTATQDTKTTTTANANAAGADVSIGLALALVIVDDEVSATISRNITASGAVGVTANGSSENTSEAIAGAKGAQSKSDNTTAGPGGSDGGNVNDKADKQLGNANTQRDTSDKKTANTSSTPDASTGDKGSSSSTKVEVAAAVAINVITTKSIAQYVGPITVVSSGPGGVVSAKTLAATIATADAKGETVGTGTDDGVGVGVSINVVDITNKATTGSSTITGTGLDVEAMMNDKNNGLIRRWDDTAKEWVLVDRGSTLPYSPSTGDFFQLTKDAPMQTIVDGADQDVASTHELKVKSLAGFASSGSFTVVGLTGTCDYTALDTANKKFTGISGCTGRSPRTRRRHICDRHDRQPRPDDRRRAHHLERRSGTSFGTGPGDFTVRPQGTCHYTGVER